MNISRIGFGATDKRAAIKAATALVRRHGISRDQASRLILKFGDREEHLNAAAARLASKRTASRL